VILATIFLAPSGTSNPTTLYGVAGPLIWGLGALQSTGNAVTVKYDYIWIIPFVLLVFAGLVGIFPLGTGVLGIVGMAIITASPYLVYPNGPVKLDPGMGFYVVWGGFYRFSRSIALAQVEESSCRRGKRRGHSDPDCGGSGRAD